MKNSSTFWSILIVLFFGACVTGSYNYQVAENVNFNKFKTFAFLPDNDTADFSVYDSEIVQDKTMAGIREEMRERGYTLDPENPDLLVMTHYMFERETDTYYNPVYPSYDYYYPGLVIDPWYSYYYVGFNTIPQISGPGWGQINYTEGTLVVDVINAENNKLLWRGWSKDRINPKRFTQKIKTYIERIFEKYPVEDQA
ncbi:MAG: DUF4136 domain-containing protein [Bacteroidales bacterium]|nr:DUF4136 domain-containing protein [Bacteroidales bacterium]MCF8352006.1 DUF4136 domain-containing protein [Bacteroidales bacterium]MCF8376577.1 DUF4136 domain-containing protein [Bacteroidales bacterium]MCF8401162.1 DUF4136 domain-containing protein [Bacteroidales bacterium]